MDRNQFIKIGILTSDHECFFGTYKLFQSLKECDFDSVAQLRLLESHTPADPELAITSVAIELLVIARGSRMDEEKCFVSSILGFQDENGVWDGVGCANA